LAEKEKEEATTPEPEYSAADALKEALAATPTESEETEESKAVTADEDETEDTTEDTDEEEESEPADNGEDEDLDDLATKLALDPDVADKLPEPVRKRYEQQVKGIVKREQRLKANEEGYQTFQNVENALYNTSREQAAKVLAEIEKSLDKHYKVEKPAERPEEKDDGTFLYDGKTFYSQTEVELYQRLQTAEARLNEFMDKSQGFPVDPELEEIKAERKAAKEEAELNKWVDANHKSLIAKVAAKTGGWGVTKEDIAKAAKVDRKALLADPVAVLKSRNPDGWADFIAGKAKKFEIHEMIDNSQAKGFKVPENPEDYGAVHAYMEVMKSQ
jgi:hypothetical protein